MKKSNLLLLITLFVLYTGPICAQPDGPAAPTPFGFVELLIGAGALYGGKKVYSERKKK